jgi:hypothetical protein
VTRALAPLTARTSVSNQRTRENYRSSKVVLLLFLSRVACHQGRFFFGVNRHLGVVSEKLFNLVSPGYRVRLAAASPATENKGHEEEASSNEQFGLAHETDFLWVKKDVNKEDQYESHRTLGRARQSYD